MEDDYWDNTPDLNMPISPRRRINTRYDQFGGYPSQSRTYKIPSPINKRIKSKLFSWSGGAEQIRDEVEDELVKLVVVPDIKKTWQEQTRKLLQAKEIYDADKASGTKIKPKDEPWPFESSLHEIYPVKHLAVLYTILAIFHDMMTQDFINIITQDIKSIHNNLDWGIIHVRLLKQFLIHVKYDLCKKGLLSLVSEPNINDSKEQTLTTTQPESTEQPDDTALSISTPETDPLLIYQADASTFYNIPKSTLSVAGNKNPGEPGYLWSARKGKRVFYRKKDCEKLSRSRTTLRKH
jgi:hypothetical protein